LPLPCFRLDPYGRSRKPGRIMTTISAVMPTMTVRGARPNRIHLMRKEIIKEKLGL
jgi:hypothetical protein